MTGAVIYKGKYGATRQYAQWFGESLQIPVLNADYCDTGYLEDKDYLLIGTSVYIGKLQIASWLNRNHSLLKDMKIFLFIVAATPPDQIEKLAGYIDAGVPAGLRANCTVYFLRGKMNMKELSWKDRLLLKMGAWLVKDPVEKKNMLTDFNAVKKENISEIINSIKNQIQLPAYSSQRKVKM